MAHEAMKDAREASKNALRVLLFVFERFGAHELANHAAAGAYAFLLSATPAFLLVLGLARALLARHPQALASVVAFARKALGPLGAGAGAEYFFSRPLGFAATFFAATFFAALSLIWAARLFVVAVQRGLRVVWAASTQPRPLRDSLLTFALELLSLVAAVALLGLSQAGRLLIERLSPVIGDSFEALLRALLGATPAALLLLFAYASYRLVPPQRPRRLNSLVAALLCVVLYSLFAALLRVALDRARYDLLYGVFGSLVVLLLNVYAFFTFYFYAAELAYVLDRFDALLFARFFRISQTEGAGRLSRALFDRPERLITAFGREYRKGETIFSLGERGKESYVLLSGSLKVYVGKGRQERCVATIAEGELFGEMAGLLDELRSATIRAETDSLAVVLPPAVFEELLATELGAARRVIALLSERLKSANDRAVSEASLP